MEEQEIINRVANSTLQVFDLEEYYPEGERLALDISQWLWEGFVLKEKEFRDSLKNSPGYTRSLAAFETALENLDKLYHAGVLIWHFTC